MTRTLAVVGAFSLGLYALAAYVWWEIDQAFRAAR